MKRNYKAEVRLSKIPRQETINYVNYDRLNALSVKCQYLKENNERLEKEMRNILYPLVNAGVPEVVIYKIKNAKYDCRFRLLINQIPLHSSLALIWDVEDEFETY